MVTIQVGQFALAGLVAVGLVALGTSIAARRIGEREAVTEARATAATRAEGLVSPVLTDALLRGDPSALKAVDGVVRLGLLDGSLVRVKVWTPSGIIVYSDEPRLIGLTYPLGPEERDAIRTGSIQADVSELAKPENRFERQFGRLLEVYLPLYTPSNQPVLFEAYFRYDAVSAAGSRLWRSFAPIAVGSLILIELVQVPLAWSLARRLRQRQLEREGLLQRALDASEIERRQIAADLHDGVVQDLAGVAYSLSAASRRMDDAGHAELFDTSADHVRASIQSLRSLLVELYPPNLEQEGLESALSDLLASARARGLETSLDVSVPHLVAPAAAQLLYRVAQEAVRNVVRHAGAHHLTVTASVADGVARLAVRDDGQGMDVERASGVAEGHLGLRGLKGLVADAGGTFLVTSVPGKGTTVEVGVPIP
jgi:two-component system NarL family sensor kinase